MLEDFPFRVALALMVVSTVGVRKHFFRKAMHQNVKVERRETHRYTRAMDLAAGLGFIALGAYIVSPASMQWASFPLLDSIRWMGLALGLSAVGLSVWVHQSLGKNFSRTVLLREDHALVIQGPYRWVRHPMYTCLFLQMIAYGLISANWAIGLLWVGGSLVFILPRIPKEEAVLVERFGDDYRDYMNRTGRFLPRSLRGAPAPRSPSHADGA